jgi:ATP-dependent protease ClpP protease subunit
VSNKQQQQSVDLPLLGGGNPILSDNWYRTIQLTGPIEEESCAHFLDAMHKLLAEDPHEMITIMISSNGGTVEEAFAMYDIIRHARRTCTVRTICYSRAYSAGSLILACGSAGYRHAYPSATAMVHGLQLEGLVFGHIKTATLPMVQNALDDYKKFVDYFAYEMLKEVKNGKEVCENKDEMDSLVEELMTIMNQDTYLNAQQMLEIGLIDKIGIPVLEQAVEEGQQVHHAPEQNYPGYHNDALDDSKWELVEVEHE